MKPLGPSLLALLLTQAPCVLADEVRVLFVDAPGGQDPRNPCFWLQWKSDVLFFNRSQEPLPVVLLGVSNGGQSEPGQSIMLPPRTAVSLQLHDAWRQWHPTRGPISVLHLDVPPAVTVSPHLNLTRLADCVSDMGFNADYGALSLPLFRSLAPAGEPQVHLLADRGSVPARINVGILNAGTVAASAHVALHDACTDNVIETRDVSIPADTLVQVEGLRAHRNIVTCPNGGIGFPTPPKAYGWANYVVITVSEASLSYVSSIADDQFPRGTLGVSGP